MLAIQGIEVITQRIDQTAAQAVHAIEAADVKPYIEAFRQRKTR